MPLQRGDNYCPGIRLTRYSRVPNSIMKLTDLSIGAKLTFGRLSQYAGKRHFCYPKQTTLAEDMGVSLQRAQRYLVELINYGLIRSEQSSGVKRWRHAPNTYYFTWHPEACSDFEDFVDDDDLEEDEEDEEDED